MRQRVMIAMALINDPKVLIADEPTTALDVTIQAQILALIERLQEQLGMAVILITHDLGVIAEIADSVNVMYAGRIVESGTLDQIFYDPQHPYTWGLLGSLRAPGPPAHAPPGADQGPAALAARARRRAATSAPAARTRSSAAPRCRRSRFEAGEAGPPRPLLALP